jgi:hypothetical protein
MNRVNDGVRARDRGTGAGERRDEAVNCRVHFAPAESLDVVTDLRRRYPLMIGTR